MERMQELFLFVSIFFFGITILNYSQFLIILQKSLWEQFIGNKQLLLIVFNPQRANIAMQ